VITTDFRRLLAPVLSCILLACTSSALADITFQTVALTGQQAPGAPAGALYSAFGAPVLNSSGQVAFYADLQTGAGDVVESNNRGIWSTGSGALSLVARSGSQAPGMPAGRNFRFLNPPVLNSAGQVAFTAALELVDEPESSTTGLWSEGSGSLALVARSGRPAPGIPLDTEFGTFNGVPLFNASGQSAFIAGLRPVGVYFPSFDIGFWSERSGALSLVARRGMQAPDTPDGAKFAGIELATLNASGQTAFSASLDWGSGGVTSSNYRGVWKDAAGGLGLVAREGDHAPGTPAGFNFRFFQRPALNGAGHTAFSANLQEGGPVNLSNGSGIWSDRSGELALVALSGTQAPGAPSGVNFYAFDDPVLNASGRMAFVAGIFPDDDPTTYKTDVGIWSDASGPLSLIARDGKPAPGTSDVFELLLPRPSINASGRVAFSAYLTTSGGAPSGAGIWAQDQLGTLTLVARDGDSLEVAPGDFRTVASLSFLGPFGIPSGGEDGGQLVFNDDFTLVFQAAFTDGSSGVFMATLTAVPEPASFAICASMATFGAAATRRKR
jgi:hypothetical protein